MVWNARAFRDDGVGRLSFFRMAEGSGVSIGSVGYGDNGDAGPGGARLRGGRDFVADDYGAAFDAGGFGYGSSVPGGAVDVDALHRPG